MTANILLNHDDIIHAWVFALERSGCRPFKEGPGWRASCPGAAHENGNRKNPALSIRRGDGGRVLARCHAGCTFEDIRHSLGMDGVSRAQSVERVESWNYAVRGELVLTVHRRDLEDGGKDIWRSPKGAKPPAAGWPLYQLEHDSN